MLLKGDPQEKLLDDFDETLKSLRRQFKKLLNETKAHKNCKLLNLSEEDSSVVTCTNANNSSEELQDEKEFISEEKNVPGDISMPEFTDEMKRSTPIKIVPKIVLDNNLALDEVPEILSVQFDTESEQSLLKQFEQSKLNSNTNEIQKQKSPVFCTNKYRGKKNFSCKIFPDIEKEKKIITSNTNTSLFSTTLKKENDIVVISPISKPIQKLGVSNIFNASCKMSIKGNKLKQTKLVFKTEEEKADISKETSIINVAAETSALDSLFDSSLFNSNINDEIMEIDMEDTFSSSKSTINNITTTTTTAATLSCSPKKSTNRIENDFEKISPAKENKQRIINVLAEGNKFQVENNSFQMDLNASYKPQATSTQFSSPNKHNMTVSTKNVHHSDSDTDFSFQEQQHTCNVKKNLVSFVKKASVLKSSSHKDYNQVSKVHINESMIDDETFFSPGEYGNDVVLKTPTKPSSSRERKLTSPVIKRFPMQSFQQIPEKRRRSPEYAYVESVRRKNERAQLDGWSCWDCKKYYQDLNLPEKELKECLKICSRHKSKYDPNYYTPPGFWNPAFPDTLCPTLPEPENK